MPLTTQMKRSVRNQISQRIFEYGKVERLELFARCSSEVDFGLDPPLSLRQSLRSMWGTRTLVFTSPFRRSSSLRSINFGCQNFLWKDEGAMLVIKYHDLLFSYSELPTSDEE